MKSSSTVSKTGQREKLRPLLDQAKAADKGDRRVEQRHPFFRPVTISTTGSARHIFSAFSRDISANGMGLVSHAPLPATKVSLTISTAAGEKLDLAGEVMSCEPCGQGWSVSSVKFVDDVS